MKIVNSRQGISLIELAVVMAIIAIAALFVVPPLGEWVKNFRLRSTARQISSDLRLAQMRTISSTWEHCVVFNETVGGTLYTYVIFPDYDKDFVLDNVNIGDLDGDGDQENETTDIFKTAVLSAKGVYFDTSKGGGDGITFANNSGGNPAMLFDRRGQVKWADGNIGQGQIYLRNEMDGRMITISSSGSIGINDYSL